MTQPSDAPDNLSRRVLATSGAALLGSTLLAGAVAGGGALAQANPPSPVAPDVPPAGYNILFVLVDEEHFFPKWPFPVPGRESIKNKGVTFLNHQIASCVCSSARSVIYTGQHIQHTGVFDNLNSLWQPDMSTRLRTIGDRLTELGYHAAYQGKWHLSANLDQVEKEIDAPIKEYRGSSRATASRISTASAISSISTSAAIPTTMPRRRRRSPGCGPTRRPCAPGAVPGSWR